MGIDERHRIALHEAAKQTWGPEVAVTLMEMLPANGWADMATKSDLDRFATKSDLDRFATNRISNSSPPSPTSRHSAESCGRR